MDKEIIHRVAKNFSSMIAAQVIYKILTFVMMIFIARYLGVEGFGQFSYGLSFVWIFLSLSDLGLTELFIRDVSSDNKLLERYISNIIVIKIFLSIAAYIALILLAYFSSFHTVKFWIILLLAGSIILDSFMYFFRSLFRVRETMEYESILMVIEALLKIGIIFFLVKLSINYTGVILLSIAMLTISIINFIINLFAFRLNYKSKFLPIDIKIWSKLLKSSFPFSIVFILSLFNFRINTMMLSWMKGDIDAGWYSVNYRLIEQIFILPFTLSYVYLPLFSRLSVSLSKLHDILKKTVFLLFIFAVIIVILFYFLGYYAIILLYGNAFAPAANYTLIISLVLLPLFIKPLLEKVLYALGKQHRLCFIYLIGVAGNILLNLFMIPRWGIKGASLTTLSAEILVVFLCIVTYQKYYTRFFASSKIQNLSKVTAEKEILYS